MRKGGPMGGLRFYLPFCWFASGSWFRAPQDTKHQAPVTDAQLVIGYVFHRVYLLQA